MFRKGSVPYQYIPYDPSSKLAAVRSALNGKASHLSPIKKIISIVSFVSGGVACVAGVEGEGGIRWGAWVIRKARSINPKV